MPRFLSLRVVVFLFLLIPAAVSAATLDDYYLSRFGLNGKSARALGAAVPGEVVQAERCLTQLHRSLQRDWPKLEPATKNALAKHVSRPVLSNAFSSPGGHFTIHYSLSGADALENVTDVSPVNGVPDWVEKVADVFENVYRAEVNEMGYRPPPVARYDVYLRNLVKEGAFGFTRHDGFPGSVTSVDSYIEVDQAFTDPIYDVDGQFTTEQLLQITAAHEFHHAIQYGYNYYFDFWYAEATAMWMEDEVYGSVNQLYNYLKYYLPKADTISLDAPLLPASNLSEYGRWIFNRYLAERYTPAVIKDVWAQLGTMAAPRDGSDIPMLSVIDAALVARGTTINGVFPGFAQKLYQNDWAATHSSEIGRIPAPAPQATYSDYPLDMTGVNASIATLPRYTFAYFKFLPAPSAPTDLTLTFANVPAAMEIVAIKKRMGNASIDEYEEYPLNRATGTISVPSFNTAATSEVQLIVSNSSSDPAPVVTAPVSSSGGGGGCFIATAAYGSYLHPKVGELRDFRDRYLLTNAPGRLFVSLYYRMSPPVARVIVEHGWMRGGVRLLLTPVLLAVEHPAVVLALFVLSGGVVVWRLTRRRRSLLAAVSAKAVA